MVKSTDEKSIKEDGDITNFLKDSEIAVSKDKRQQIFSHIQSFKYSSSRKPKIQSKLIYSSKRSGTLSKNLINILDKYKGY